MIYREGFEQLVARAAAGETLTRSELAETFGPHTQVRDVELAGVLLLIEALAAARSERKRIAEALYRAADAAEYGTPWEALRRAAELIETEDRA